MTITAFDPTKSAFKFNETYDPDGQNEANTYREIYLEGTWKHGSDVIFIERGSLTPEPVFVESLGETLTRGTPLRMFVEEVEGWGGMGDTFSKFGIRVGDEMTAYCPKELFVRTRPDDPNFFPHAGDLVYYVPGKKLFEITSVEDEATPSFYLFGNHLSYKIICRLYNYEHSEVEQDPTNGIPDFIKALDLPAENAVEIARNEQPWVDYVQTSGVIDETEKDALE